MSWIIDDGKLYEDLNITFIKDPEMVEKLFVFNKKLFLDDDNMCKLLASNRDFTFGRRTFLWNELKYHNSLETREYEQEQSRLDWELRKDLGEI